MNSLVSAIEVLLTWPNILFIVAGTLLGLLVGVLPGIGGPVTIAILIPITFTMDPSVAFLLLGATLGGSTFGGSITAILVNIPGTAPNAATLLDGYPMTKEGQGMTAIGASAAASALGALFGLIILLLSIPFLEQLVLLFGPPEFFWLGILGVVVAAMAARGSILDGIISGLFGFLITFHGPGILTGVGRYTFDQDYLLSGLSLIPVIIGIFAISEMIELGSKRMSIVQADIPELDSPVNGIRAVLKNPRLLMQSSAIGTVIGMVPALGGVVATFVAYATALRSVDDNERFGQGDIRGVIASEAANDAKDGGALMPTLALGIPGSTVMAVLLGGFAIHGITPGTELLTENREVVYSLIFALIISNFLTSAIGIATAKQLVRIVSLPIEYIIPPITIVSLIGIYLVQLSLIDVVVAIGFGVIGYIMIRYNISRIPLVIGFVLSPIVERQFWRTLQISRGDPAIFFTQPIPLISIALVLALLFYPLIRDRALS